MTSTLPSSTGAYKGWLRLRAMTEGALSAHYLLVSASEPRQRSNLERLDAAVQARVASTGQSPADAEEAELSDQFLGVALVVSAGLAVSGSLLWTALQPVML